MDCSMGSQRIGHAWAIFTFTFKQLHMILWDKCFYHHHFTEEKTEADRQSDLPKATQRVNVQNRDSNLWCLSPETMYLARIQKSFYFYNPSRRKWELLPLKMSLFKGTPGAGLHPPWCLHGTALASDFNDFVKWRFWAQPCHSWFPWCGKNGVTSLTQKLVLRTPCGAPSVTMTKRTM